MPAPNWAKAAAGWLPLNLMPSKAGPIVFANADRTKMWFVKSASGPVDSGEGDKADAFAPAEII